MMSWLVTVAARLRRAVGSWFFEHVDAVRDVGDTALGFAVRRTSPDGEHELVCFRCNAGSAQWDAFRDRLRWRALYAPVEYAVVVISRKDFTAHRLAGSCMSEDCSVRWASSVGQAR